MRGARSAHGGRAFASMLAILAFLGAGWLAGLAFRSARSVRTWPVRWPVDAAPGIELSVARGSRSTEDRGRRIESPDGPPTPELHIFGDYECGACLSMHVRLGARLIDLASAGRLRVWYHMAPLSAHWRGAVAGEIAYCLPAQRRALAHTRIFEATAQWLAAADPEAAILGEVAEGAQDMAVLRACVASGAGRRAVERDRALAAALGVHAVPGVFLNGARIEFDSWRSLRRFIERAASP